MIIKHQSRQQKFFSAATMAKLKNLIKKTGRYALLLIIIVPIFLLVIFQANWLQPRIEITPNQVFYQQPVEVSLETQGVIGNHLIRYTLDGSDPNPDSQIYQQPLLVSRPQTIKAAIFRSSKKQRPLSQPFTFDVLVDADHQLPVVTLTTAPKNLWDPDFGIYVKGNHNNYEQTGSDWQRPALFRFYEPDGSLGLSLPIGIRMHGGGSRELPQKTFRLYANPDNPDALFDYPFFPDSQVSRFRTLLLRNSASDWNYAFMRDVVTQRLAAKYSQVDTQPDRPVVVYLNGQYWGIYYIRDRYDQEYFHQKYQLDPSKLTILEVPHDHGADRGEVVIDEGKYQSDADEFNRLYKEAQKCRDCADFNYFNQYIDLQNFIDYNIFEIHFANFDWPYGNNKLWRYHNTVADQNRELIEKFPRGLDGRYRWLMYDLDVGFGFSSDDHEEMKLAAKNGDYGRLIDDRFPFRNLFYNPTFQENFFNRYANLLATAFNPTAVKTEIDQLVSELRSEMPRQIARWKDEVSPLGLQFSQSMDDWLYQVDLLKTYADYRSQFMRQNTLRDFADDMRLSHLVQIELDVRQTDGKTGSGTIQTHRTLLESNQFPFSNQYFPLGSINIEALPRSGYVFDHWEGDVYPAQKNRAKQRLELIRDYQLTAVFKPKKLF